ncbi:MAG: hypothetical protein NT018_14330 [Armatimonadetes bacterium]|nr:hypothetical protein [Armatimonadota bacterium]
MRKLVLILIILAATAAGLYTGYLTSREKPQLPQGPTIFVSFLDANHGGGCVIRTPEGKCALIDPGPHESVIELTNYLREKGIDELKLIITNPTSNRSGAVQDILESFIVTDLIIGEKPGQSYTRLKAGQTQFNTRIMTCGDIINLSRTAKLTVISPPRGLLKKESKYSDNNSLVLQLTFGKTRFLLCSDIRPAAEAYLVKSDIDIESDILVLPRSPRYDSNSLEFLSRVRPAYCILPCGGRFGAPGAGLLRRVDTKNSGAYIYRTDKDGTIEVIADGHNILVTGNGGGQNE